MWIQIEDLDSRLIWEGQVDQVPSSGELVKMSPSFTQDESDQEYVVMSVTWTIPNRARILVTRFPL